MMTYLALLMIGAAFGFFTCALLTAGKLADLKAELWRATHDPQYR